MCIGGGPPSPRRRRGKNGRKRKREAEIVRARFVREIVFHALNLLLVLATKLSCAFILPPDVTARRFRGFRSLLAAPRKERRSPFVTRQTWQQVRACRNLSIGENETKPRRDGAHPSIPSAFSTFDLRRSKLAAPKPLAR